MTSPNQLPAPIIENQRRLLEFLKTFVTNEALPPAILRSAYKKGYEKAGEIKERETMMAWFFRMIRNGAIDQYAAAGEEKSHLERLVARSYVVGKGADASLERALYNCVNGLLETLKPDNADMIRKIELEGKKLEDVAAEEKMAVANAATSLHRAREALKKKILQTCGACPTHASMDCACFRPAPALKS